MTTTFNHASLTKGVSFDKRSNRWVGRFTLNGQRHYVGTFKEELHATRAVNRAKIDAMGSYFLRNEIKDILEEQKSMINTTAISMSSVQEWNTLTLPEIKEFAEKQGITHLDVMGDKRFKQNWIDVVTTRGVRPITRREPVIAKSIAEIDTLIDYLGENEKNDRDYSDRIVLTLPKREWNPCVIIDPREPSYFWCNDGFIYTLFPAEGYTIWRFDENFSGNYKQIGVWVGPNANENDPSDELKWEVSIDKVAGTYCKIRRSGGDIEEGEILENWVDGAIISPPLSENSITLISDLYDDGVN